MANKVFKMYHIETSIRFAYFLVQHPVNVATDVASGLMERPEARTKKTLFLLSLFSSYLPRRHLNLTQNRITRHFPN